MERLVRLENANCDATDDVAETPACNPCNPFDFNTICDYFECPALDLIANHYPDYAPSTTLDPLALALDDDDDDDDDDDMFEVVQIFDLPSK